MSAAAISDGFLGFFKGLAAFQRRTAVRIPLAVVSVAAGFPSPADDYIEKRLDFNDLIVEDGPATFVAKVTGESMRDAGILDGDLVVINRARTAVSGDIVVACVDGEFTIKRYFDRGRDILLKAANPDFADIVVAEGQQFEVWGVIRRVIRIF